ncbi:hypothetical protein CCAX7_14340 [Capsulimonas corticalis]|uniref:Uncharacterized protein n=1 Tax=Capsulimonas corticalis TaxID=2219043 RepID=A0A402D731_9BACT|nr:hypothetical protein [Capsulimonas corticalis]BDI29383.1 hypothetical protein CCAX7_14340 [Capsulimonas corticalis]
MPNRNYIKGREGEYIVVNMLKSLGYVVTRAAASHGVFDVVALGVRGRHTHNLAIQVKRGKTKPSPCEYQSSIDADLLDSNHRMVLYLPTEQPSSMPRVIYSNIEPLPDWCAFAGWQLGMPPKQMTLRLPRK